MAGYSAVAPSLDSPSCTDSDQGTPRRNQDLGHPRSLVFQVLVSRGGAGKAERKDRTLEPDTLTNIFRSTFVLLIN